MPERMRSDIDRNANNIDRLQVVTGCLMGGMIFIALLVVWVGYQGRVDQRTAQVTGCKAAKVDRARQANAWHEAQRARLQTVHDPSVSNEARVSAAHAASVYGETVQRLVARADVGELNPDLRGLPDAGSYDCDVAYPAPSFLPLGSSEAH